MEYECFIRCDLHLRLSWNFFSFYWILEHERCLNLNIRRSTNNKSNFNPLRPRLSLVPSSIVNIYDVIILTAVTLTNIIFWQLSKIFPRCQKVPDLSLLTVAAVKIFPRCHFSQLSDVFAERELGKKLTAVKVTAGVNFWQCQKCHRIF